jgi:hypothetical protein
VNAQGKPCHNVCVNTGVLCRFHVNQNAGKQLFKPQPAPLPVGPVKPEPTEEELSVGPMNTLSDEMNIVGGEVLLSGDEAAMEAEAEDEDADEDEAEEGGHEGEGEFFREDIQPPHVAMAPNKRKVAASPGSPPRQPKQPRSTDSGDEGAPAACRLTHPLPPP